MIRYLLAACLLLLAACGSGSTTPPPPAAAPQSGGTPEAAAFPVTIDHKYGSTTIKAEPKRIVLVGLMEQDALLALGVVPVATTDWLKKHEGAIAPWATAKLGSAPKPTVLVDEGSGPQMEKIAALRPDAIIGLYSGLTQEQYDKLSKIAPTVAQPKQFPDYGIGWQEMTRKVGQVVGKPAQADKLIAESEALIAKARKENPKFEQSTAVIATTWEGYFVYGSNDPRTRLLHSLGFKSPEQLDKVIGDKFGISISKEQTEMLDQDVVIWLAGPQTKEALAKDPVYSSLKVAKEKRDILIDEASDYGSSVSFISVLSLPFLLEKYVPQLAAAVK
ncbi:iron-siderophore ABC transporter substrate-binding protein [Kibdelosporangium phytohabitans]|uniref:Iron ABC transporter substrate-binding protein n=1 Tax=Kibdelosporangium phytohabitans TaxID=860235 RepID=A0A0N9HYC1_9PSEU|nr:iron-siderophore ABC transporter substrate-binding protein [Kibdelosporangium phytohabitans]ALG07101.1 iron ABC transporter substrate-binding protein [Kibdelosporangium phytohabitans]MBE1468413.1 iron complex transport system substrate-binding protein [Kibdelosporangium phytohabitans]